MVYLIGINHNIQHNGVDCASLELQSKFIQFLKEKIKKFNIVFIAEEFNEDALNYSRGTVATVKKVAMEAKIKHRFCDPGIKERKEKNIISESELRNKLVIRPLMRKLNKGEQKILKTSFLEREKLWFECMEDKINEPIIFICGEEHIESFKKLLNDKGGEAQIVVFDLGEMRYSKF